jgi:sec-independent protein translocase protein TatA
LIVLAIILLIFGPGKLSGLGSALGSSIRDFKRATKDENADAEAGTKTANGNVKSVADDAAEPVHALPAQSVVMEAKPASAKSVVELDDEPVGVSAGNGAESVKIGNTRRGYSRR